MTIKAKNRGRVCKDLSRMMFGSKKFPSSFHLSPAPRMKFPVPFNENIRYEGYQRYIRNVSKVRLYMYVKTTKIQPDMVEIGVTVSSAIAWCTQRGTKRSRTEAKHVLMFQRVGSCYPDWVIEPMSAKGIVKHVTDNQ